MTQPIPLLRMYSQELKAGSWRDIYTLMFIRALFTISKTWSGPSVHQWTNKQDMVHTYKKTFSLKKRRKFQHKLQPEWTWGCYDSTYHRLFKVVKFIESTMAVARGWGKEGMESYRLMGIASVLQDEEKEFCRWMVVMAATTWIYNMTTHLNMVTAVHFMSCILHIF